jgi:predicted DsbA family dithiol-disulfide isomerase
MPRKMARKLARTEGQPYVRDMKTLAIDIWSDIACPFCYVGKRRLEAALALFPHRDAVRVVWRAFELDPSAPALRDASVSHAGRIAAKYGMPVAEAERMMRDVTEMAAGDGLDLRFDKVQSGNTFDAHRVVHLAAERGVQDAVKERLLAAYFGEGACMSDPVTLVRLGSEAGLDPAEVREVVSTDKYAAAVRADEAAARELGIRGVPFFVIGGRHGVSGAQPARALLGVLERAWASAKDEAPTADGAACGPDGCAS